MTCISARWFRLAAALVFTLIALEIPVAVAQEPATPPTGRISGIVTRRDTAESIRGARVTLHLETEPEETSRRVRRETITDSSGRFEFTGVEAGKYRIGVQRSGFLSGGDELMPDFAERRLEAGEVKSDLRYSMIAAASLSGVIRDAQSNPLALVEVELLIASSQAGKRVFYPVASVITNDRGEYRFEHVGPGRYYVAAGIVGLRSALNGYFQVSMPPVINGASGMFARAYWPGTSDPARAEAIDLTSNSSGSADLALAPAPPRQTVRGKIVDARTGRAPGKPRLSLMTEIDGRLETFPLNLDGQKRRYDSATGAFEIGGVPPGDYTLVVTIGSEGSGQGYVPPVAAGTLLLAVRGVDVAGLLVTLNPGVVVSGRAVLEGEVGPAFASGILIPTFGGRRVDSPPLPSAQIPYPNGGTFRIENVMPGEYELKVYLPAGTFLKEALLAGVNVLDEPFVIAGPESGPLTIVLSRAVGKVSGKVLIDALETNPGLVSVLLVPSVSGRAERSKSTEAERDGSFEIPDVAPGSYRLFALTSASTPTVRPHYAPIDVDELMTTRGGFIHVEVLPGGTVSVEIRPILASQ